MSDLTRINLELWRQVTIHLWQSLLFLAPLSLLALGLRSAPARLCHALWWTALVKLLVPLALVGALLGPTLPASGRPALVEHVRVVLDAPAGPIHDAALDRRAGVAWLPTALWCLGAGALAIRWARRRRGLSGAWVPLDRAAPAERERLGAALRGGPVSEGSCRLGAADVDPCVVGWLRPRIVMSNAVVNTLDIAELRAVLLHEEAHRRRRDGLGALVVHVAVLVFFYFPPVWWIARRLHETAEQACDEYALRNGAGAVELCRALARTLALRHGPLLASAGFARRGAGLARRIEHIRQAGRIRVMKRHVVVLSCALALFGASAAVSVSQSVGSEAFVKYDHPVLFQFEGESLEKLLAALSEASGIRFTLEGGDLSVDADYGTVPLGQGLFRLGLEWGLTFEVTGPQEITVRAPWVAGQNGITFPQLLEKSKVAPEYPPDARAARVEGKVMLQAVVASDGTVGALTVLREEPEGHGFAEAAKKAVAQWRYKPARRGGEPVDVYFTIMINFNLS